MIESNTIVVNNIGVQRGEQVFCAGVGFELTTGEALHIIGKNGAGKTTFLKLFAGILPVQTGSIFLPKHLKTLFLGHSSAVFGALSVFDNLAHLASLDRFARVGALNSSRVGEHADRLMHSLNQVGLLDVAHKKASKLSSGQLRRIGLARLWLSCEQGDCDTQLWLLDEPLTAIDKWFVSALEDVTLRFVGQGGRVIFTSHQPFLQHMSALRRLHLSDSDLDSDNASLQA